MPHDVLRNANRTLRESNRCRTVWRIEWNNKQGSVKPSSRSKPVNRVLRVLLRRPLKLPWNSQPCISALAIRASIRATMAEGWRVAHIRRGLVPEMQDANAGVGVGEKYP